MPDLLLELFSEEIPARFQARAAEDLKRLVTGGLVDAGLTYEGARALATPRRLALTVQGITARSRDVSEERKGPRTDAPEKAVEGFLRGAGLTSVAEAEVRSDPKKGDFYVAVVRKPGRSAQEIAAELIPQVIRSFPWPKSMRWGTRSAPVGTRFSPPEAEGTAALRWVRPLRSILCTFGPETEEPEVIAFEVGGIASSDLTYGHRFLSAGPIRAKRFDDYAAKLEGAYVVLDPERRRGIIDADARTLAFAKGLELVDDPALLDEVAGLVEWPVVLMGAFDEAFLAIPEEVIRLTIRNNQKCFVLRRGDGAGGGLANRFVLVANTEAADGGAAIVAGNERVVAARLSDARFFWEQDLKVPLEAQAEKLKAITFHEKLGTQAERVERIARLARELAPLVGADSDDAERAARLAKADLVTGMVGEFPELQGVMGRYYALAQGEKPAIADAIRDHYRPAGANDVVPREPVAVAVALADKLDTLVGFWAIDEKPTGSKDPYALRRAALGVIRLVLENRLCLKLVEVSISAQVRVQHAIRIETGAKQVGLLADMVSLGISEDVQDSHFWAVEKLTSIDISPQEIRTGLASLYDLLAFFADRLKVHLREVGARHDLIDAVFALPGQDDLLMIVRRVEALGNLLDTEDGANLLTGYRRAANILRAEEKKDGRAYDGPPDPALVRERGQEEERTLLAVIGSVEAEAEKHLAAEDFEGAMRSLSELRPAVDAFFDRVTVNADDAALRENRLRLLNRIREAMHKVADFSRIAG